MQFETTEYFKQETFNKELVNRTGIGVMRDWLVRNKEKSKNMGIADTGTDIEPLAPQLWAVIRPCWEVIAILHQRTETSL